MKRLFVFIMVNLFLCAGAFGADGLKDPNVSGTFYPSSGEELLAMVRGYLASGEVDPLHSGVIIAPHAGYVYSGEVAGKTFKAVSGRKVATVVILAPSHYYAFEGASVWAEGVFRTPLGDVAVDSVLAGNVLSSDKRFVFERAVFEREHAVETQLPFIQATFPQARIVPIILGRPDFDLSNSLGRVLSEVVGDRDDVLICVSSDQSHFHRDEEARKIDQRGLAAIEQMDVRAFWNGHVDGSMEVDAFHAITAAMIYAGNKGHNIVRIVDYKTSFDTTRDSSRVVGYAGVLISSPPLEKASKQLDSIRDDGGLSDQQRARLLEIARSTLDMFVRTGKIPAFVESDARLRAEEGAFVTLRHQGQLRGCIGNILGRGPLFNMVRDMAVAAASEDPRFPGVTPGELSEIKIEISVLSRPRRIATPNEVVLGKHGVIVSRGGRKGVFLPQVAVETGWDLERFLSELCVQKTGLSADAWKDAATTLEVFTADVFGE
jgi:AmmeMemoRadiSam system protein B/AmmeMemoRadiSam system protein A